MRDDAAKILWAAVAAVEPRAAVRRSLRLETDRLSAGDTTLDLAQVERVLIVGVGKAAVGMTLGALDVLGDRASGGVVTTRYGHGAAISGVEVVEAAHPVPDEEGLRGALATLDLVRGAGERDLVLCLLSGGASALWPATAEGILLEDLQAVTDVLLRSGAAIRELNTVRKHLSAISGGLLAREAAPAAVLTLVLSDVVGSPHDVIASGPTTPDPTTYADALAVLDQRGVGAAPSVRRRLEAGLRGQVPETPKPGDSAFECCSNHIVARNRDALDAAAREARARGYEPLILTTRLTGEARFAGELLAALALDVRADGLPLAPPCALLLGGETTVNVRGDGVGGRNQEAALAAALALSGTPNVLAACLGTDGADGPTDAAGGVVDGGTVERGARLGLAAAEYLRRNDSHTYLRTVGDLLVTGPTGTNVNDVSLVLVRRAPNT